MFGKLTLLRATSSINASTASRSLSSWKNPLASRFISRLFNSMCNNAIHLHFKAQDVLASAGELELADDRDTVLLGDQVGAPPEIGPPVAVAAGGNPAHQMKIAF